MASGARPLTAKRLTPTTLLPDGAKIMKLTYWYAQCLDDSEAYSVREKTKKAAVQKVADNPHTAFGPVTKVTVEYDNAFDLMEQCMGEGRGYWER
jgi:hypothetical protein